MLTKATLLGGLSEDRYVIEHILESIGASVGSIDIKKLQYKVYYEPLIDTKIRVERSNIHDTENTSYKILNQDVQLISDTMFAQSTSRKLERLSNRFISANL